METLPKNIKGGVKMTTKLGKHNFFFLPEVLKILWLAIFQAWSLWDTSFFLARTFKNSLAGDIPGLVILGGGASSKILSLLSSPELSELLEELSPFELSSLELENGH